MQRKRSLYRSNRKSKPSVPLRHLGQRTLVGEQEQKLGHPKDRGKTLIPRRILALMVHRIVVPIIVIVVTTIGTIVIIAVSKIGTHTGKEEAISVDPLTADRAALMPLSRGAAEARLRDDRAEPLPAGHAEVHRDLPLEALVAARAQLLRADKEEDPVLHLPVVSPQMIV